MSEEFGPDFISVTDEDGNEFELELIDTLEHEGVTYYAMLPAVEEDEETGEPVDVDADDEEFGLVIMKAIEENGEEILSTPDTDEELDAIYNLFMERFFVEATHLPFRAGSKRVHTARAGDIEKEILLAAAHRRCGPFFCTVFRLWRSGRRTKNNVNKM